MDVNLKMVCRVKEIMSTLLPYLSVVDYINLRVATVNAISSSIMSPTDLLMQRFIHRISTETLITEECRELFIQLLTKRDHFYLSGGFLVALLRGDPFDLVKQDVDFFVTEESYQGTLLQQLDNFQNNAFPHNEDENYGNSMNFMRVFDLKDIRCQFIVHESKEILHHSIFGFDLPVCRNYFSKRAGLKIHKLEDLTRHSTKVNTLQLLNRIHGLEHRTSLTELYKRNAFRIEKYRKRGFDVTIHLAKEEDLRAAIPTDSYLGEDRARNFDKVFAIMGVHNPPSCVFTVDCKCKTDVGAQRRYCFRNFRCQCDHHQVFRTQAAEKFVVMRREAMVQEHLDFWGEKI